MAAYNIKGGVGKTAVALTLAHLAVEAGHRTLIWDLDEQGGASTILGHPPEVGRRRPRRTYQVKEHIRPSQWAGLDLLPADALLHLVDRHDRPRHGRELLQRLSDNYDRIYVDCPPTLGLLTDQIFEMADLVVVPMLPATLSVASFDQLRAYLTGREDRRPELLPLYSMVDRRRRAHREALDKEPDRLAIPYASAMEQMAALGRPVTKIAPSSAVAKSMTALSGVVEDRLSQDLSRAG